MAATQAKKGFGTIVEYLVTAPSTYAPIGELMAVTPPNRTREVIDSTHMLSPDGYREFISSLRDGGEAGHVYNYTAAGYAILEEQFDDDEPTQYRITLVDGATVVYRALITEHPIDEITIDGKVGMSANMKVTGKPVFTVPA